MEATRGMLLKRQCEPLWLSLLGIQDNHSPTTSRCFSLADVCGGTGAISRWLLAAKASLSAIVIDNDTNLLEYGRTLAAFEGINDRIQFLLSDARTISVDDGSVDCAFIHGALHLLEDGEDAIVEMVRIARKRVTVFCADTAYTAPLEKNDFLTPFDEKISELERKIFNMASRDFDSLKLPDTAISHEDVPIILKSMGCKDIRVRGIMESLDFDELSIEEYIAFRRTESEEMNNKATAFASLYGLDIEGLIDLYKNRRDYLIKEHRRGKRNFLWTGGPVIVWIGLKG